MCWKANCTPAPSLKVLRLPPSRHLTPPVRGFSEYSVEVLRAEILSEFYGVSVRVHYEDDGTAIVIPNRRARA